jgi:putative Mg2+ transporter-C (MgtC) family protein
MEAFTTDLHIAQILIIRVLVSLILGVIIGIERGISHKAVGFRTISLVCVSSTGFTLISIYGFEGVDTSRIAAQVVSGIGFLGAGAILHKGYITKGLTTAAALWIASAIGMACGTGMFVLALILTLMTLILLWVLKPFKIHLDRMIDNESGNGNGSKVRKKKIIERTEPLEDM